jgi:hypothetical protein
VTRVRNAESRVPIHLCIFYTFWFHELSRLNSKYCSEHNFSENGLTKGMFTTENHRGPWSSRFNELGVSRLYSMDLIVQNTLTET